MPSVIVSLLLSSACYAVAAVACATRAARAPRDRIAWALLAAAIAAYAGANAIWGLAGDHAYAAVPPVAHVLWLAFYVLGYTAVALLLRARQPQLHLSFWVDGIIAGLTAATMLAAFVVPAIDLDASLGTFELVSGLTYASADLLLLALPLWALSVTGWARGQMWLALTVAFALLTGDDIVSALRIAAGISDPSATLVTLDAVAALCIGLAAHLPVARSRPLRMDSVQVLILPLSCVLAAIGVLLAAGPLDLSPAGHMLALAVIGAGVVRAVVTLRELGSLYESRRLERGFEDAAIGMAVLSRDLRIQRVNDSLCRLLGLEADALAGEPLSAFADPRDRALLDRIGAEPATIELRLRRADGWLVDVVLTTALIGDDEPDPYLFCQIEDVTARRRAERHTAAAAELGRRAIRIRDVRALMDEVVAVTSETLEVASCFVGRYDHADAALVLATTVTEYRNRTYDLTGRTMIEALVREGTTIRCNEIGTDPRFEEHWTVRERGFTRTLGTPIPRRADGSYTIIVHRRPDQPPFVPEDERCLEAIANVLATALDRAETEAATRHQALHDPLTGLANRAFLHAQLDQALTAARRDRSRVALLLLDVDRFKLVNDTVGHSAGDAVLVEVADRLRRIVRGGDLAARLGGDEFVVAAGGIDDERDVAALAGRIVDAFAEPFGAGGRQWQLGASVGVALGDGHATADDLLRDADLAMYRAKDAGGARYELFDAAMRARMVERLGLEAALQVAVERGELALHYQPIVDLRTGELEGFEALLRWEHPERGLVGPDAFISIAEDTDLILPIGHWVLRTACAQIAAWNVAWPDRTPIHVRVNVSPRQITPALGAAVATAIRQTGIAPAQLGLEITERLLVEEPTARDALAEVREHGVGVALDDFGTGYSSLSYLRSYPVDVVKLDRSLIAELGRAREATAIVKAAIDMASALGLRVVGEGIEEPIEALELRRLGCTLGQGFLFAPPLPPAEADALLGVARPFDAPVVA
jgi:diguanylate cyclase (GGDEF)-like protein/PAS domain S-box-containing protein